MPALEIPGVPSVLLQALVAAAGGARLALVGGVVRDLLLHREHNDPWRGLPDLDLVVEGRAIDLVQRLVRQLPAGSYCNWREHGSFGTVEVELACADVGVWLLDVASARHEVYPVPAENPRVSFGVLEDDLARRDFSVNAMAMVLSADGSGVELLDPHHGQEDLARRCLRLLHHGSLMDDPTRLIRAARYAARLDFQLDAHAEEQARDLIARWPWCWRPEDPAQQAPPALSTRLRMELELLLDREPWLQALEHLQAWGGLALLDPGLQKTRRWRSALHRAERHGLSKLPVLLACGSDPVSIAARLQIPHRQQRELRGLSQLRCHLATLVQEGISSWGASEWTEWLEAHPDPEHVVTLALLCGDRPRRPLLHWWFRWRHVDAGVSASELLASGVPQGPAIGNRLRQLRAERLAEGPELLQ